MRVPVVYCRLERVELSLHCLDLPVVQGLGFVVNDRPRVCHREGKSIIRQIQRQSIRQNVAPRSIQRGVRVNVPLVMIIVGHGRVLSPDRRATRHRYGPDNGSRKQYSSRRREIPHKWTSIHQQIVKLIKVNSTVMEEKA